MKVSVVGLRKFYGRTRAVDDITFDFAGGQIFGFVGPNGAGKSTTMRVLATLDGTTSLLVALVARRLGGSRDAGRFALLLYAVSIPAFAVLQFGFSAQVFGQWFTAPLLLLLLASARPPQPRTWLMATLLLLFGMFSHIGVAILGVAWMGFTLLLTLLHDRRIVETYLGIGARAAA